MRSRMFIVAAVIFAALSSTNAKKVTVDVDRTFDFKTFKTYSWAVGQIAPKATTGQMLITAVERELNARGLVKNDAEADLNIAMMAAADMDLQGVGPSWNNERYRYWGGHGNPAALMNISKGTLLIDLVDTNAKISVWRGVARDIFVQPPSGNLEKDLREMESIVNKTVGKMFKKYPVSLNK